MRTSILLHNIEQLPIDQVARLVLDEYGKRDDGYKPVELQLNPAQMPQVDRVEGLAVIADEYVPLNHLRVYLENAETIIPHIHFQEIDDTITLAIRAKTIAVEVEEASDDRKTLEPAFEIEKNAVILHTKAMTLRKTIRTAEDNNENLEPLKQQALDLKKQASNLEDLALNLKKQVIS